MGEEGELLAHERAVDAVLAGDLAEQAAQLGRALARRAGALGRDQHAQALERHVRARRTPSSAAGALQQADALLLEPARGGPSRSGSRRAWRARRRRRGPGSPRPGRARAAAAAAPSRSGRRDGRAAPPRASGSSRALPCLHRGVELRREAEPAGARSASVMASATAPARGPSASDEPLVISCDELADEQLLEAERRLVGLLVGRASPRAPRAAARCRRSAGAR